MAVWKLWSALVRRTFCQKAVNSRATVREEELIWRGGQRPYRHSRPKSQERSRRARGQPARPSLWPLSVNVWLAAAWINLGAQTESDPCDRDHKRLMVKICSIRAIFITFINNFYILLHWYLYMLAILHLKSIAPLVFLHACNLAS
ncbi:hypothetical protein O6H91_22G053000 [Diphasiastrum complanatum]|uniref:Uncharacterized protein n=2 Tax=Diphasiastrum complanatum TaxID=34168 RepID=A0ACC2AFH6_DIPCM|nr:hypothetical protein O6H91_22G053000 [Diphasiastrum complanatum]KAJ7516314.1 hypothetical protein O6H91_22G053000 [Diphasiastrum complanatum]